MAHLVDLIMQKCEMNNDEGRGDYINYYYTEDKKVSEYDIENATITLCRPTHGTLRKRHRTLTLTRVRRHQKTIKVKQPALSSPAR